MMAGNSDPPDKKCRYCGKLVSTNDIKCINPKCDITIHIKCADAILRVVDFDKNCFRCRKCLEEYNCELKSKGKCESNSDTMLLNKEIECLTREKQILEKYVNELEYLNAILKSKVPVSATSLSQTSSFLPQSDKNVKSYSAAAKIKVNSDSVLLVRSMNQNIKNIQVEADIKSKVNPRAANANVVGTKLIKNGILINCSDSASLDNLKKCINSKVGKAYTVTEPKKFKPRLMIHNVSSSSVEQPNLINEIIEANQLNVTTNDLKIITKMKYKDVFNVVLETSAELFHDITNKGFLYVGWVKCYVKEHFSLTKCFKCCKFGHHKTDCHSEITCPKCSGPHEKNACTSESLCCNNCKLFNSRFKLNVSTDHSTNSPNCSYLLNRIDNLKSRTDYG
ncbi:unnamed protein product [Psylliodes chrysocephalus]|uniref:CCHC-type domain-containing protein n=1 Tax=Psylliodes chrysocephalus TaxID=3402493 RepID=A0A9P0C9R5_9CUCU|nr:unnamed protein product [Psylliodes chrysocephala]